MRCRGSFDSHELRSSLRFGDFEAPLADADLAQLHDTLLRLHAYHDPEVRSLCVALRRMALREPDAPDALELGLIAARKVQLAVYADKTCRMPVSKSLGYAREQAFRYLETIDSSANRG